MDLVIKINIDNAAFEYDSESEISRILDVVKDKIISGYSESKLFDINGNSIGNFEFI